MPFYASFGNLCIYSKTKGWIPLTDNGKGHVTLAWRQDEFDEMAVTQLNAWPAPQEFLVSKAATYGFDNELPGYELAFMSADQQERGQAFRDEHLQKDEEGRAFATLTPHIASNNLPVLFTGDLLRAGRLTIKQTDGGVVVYERILYSF